MTPNLIPPSDLRNILIDIGNRLQANPKLTLPNPKGTSIWAYYEFLKITAFVHHDILIVILTLPLIDTDLQFDLFKIHNLPLLHPVLGKVFTYKISHPYIALRSDGNYLTLPVHDDILTCIISAGHFCNLNTPLYPVSLTKICEYHLLMNQPDEIEKFCKMTISNYVQDTALNLGGNVWALSLREPTTLHVTCLADSYEIRVKSTFQLIELENSCQAYSPSIILPSGSIIREMHNVTLISERFFNYDPKHSNLENFFVMSKFNLTHVSPKALNVLAHDLPELPDIPIRNISDLLKNIDKDYPFEMPTYAYVLISVAGTAVIILLVGVIYYAKF